MSCSIVVPFKLSVNDLETLVIVFKTYYGAVVDMTIQQMQSKIVPGLEKISTVAEWTSLFNLSADLREKLSQRGLDFKPVEIKRLLNWLVSGDFYGEFSDFSEIFPAMQSFMDYLHRREEVCGYTPNVRFEDIDGLRDGKKTGNLAIRLELVKPPPKLTPAELADGWSQVGAKPAKAAPAAVKVVPTKPALPVATPASAPAPAVVPVPVERAPMKITAEAAFKEMITAMVGKGVAITPEIMEALDKAATAISKYGE